jgi:hypothetical protein
MSHAALYKMWLAAYKHAEEVCGSKQTSELPKCWWLFSQFRGNFAWFKQNSLASSKPFSLRSSA